MLNLIANDTSLRLLEKQNQNKAYKKIKNSKMFSRKFMNEVRKNFTNQLARDFGALAMHHLEMVT